MSKSKMTLNMGKRGCGMATIINEKAIKMGKKNTTLLYFSATNKKGEIKEVAIKLDDEGRKLLMESLQL